MNDEFKLSKELTKRDVDYLTAQIMSIDKSLDHEAELIRVALASMQGYLIGAGLIDICSSLCVADPEFYRFIIVKIREFDGKYAETN